MNEMEKWRRRRWRRRGGEEKNYLWISPLSDDRFLTQPSVSIPTGKEKVKEKETKRKRKRKRKRRRERVLGASWT